MNKKYLLAVGVVILVVAAAIIGIFMLKNGTQPEFPAQDTAPTAATQSMSDTSGMSAENTPPPAEATAEEAPTVEFPEDSQKRFGVKTTPAEVKALTRTVRLTGRIGYDEKNIATVNTKVEGWVERLYVDYEGRYLKKGEPVIEIYSPDLLAAQQELISLLSAPHPVAKSPDDALVAADWERLADAARRRLKLWDVTDAQIRQIERLGKPMRTISIASPVSGYVVKRYASRGVKVMAGEPLLDIVNLTKVWVLAEVNEPDIDLVRVGMPVKIAVAGLPGMVLNSSIDYVYPTMNAQTRSLKVRATLPNPDEVLKPQMYATVEIAADLGKKLLVPEDAVIDTGERQIVYVDKGQGNFEPRAVTAGIRAGGQREILAGLKSGERVASSALFLIDSEAQLKGVTPAPVPHAAAPSPVPSPAPPYAGHQH